MTRLLAVLAVVLLSGCASYSGRDLQPGKATAGDVTALMGPPGMEVKRPNGDTWLYFPRNPWGRVTYVAALGPDGLLIDVEQRLTYDNIHSIKKDQRIEDVRLLLGPPREVWLMPRTGWPIWEYAWWFANKEMRVLWVYYSVDDGVVRRVTEQHDYNDQPENSRF